MPNRQTNSAKETLSTPSEPHAGAVRILLADDQEEVRLAIANLLEGEFDVIGTAENGQRAVELVPVLCPDVLVLDVCMPVLNGIETAVELKKSGSAPKVVFLTVNDDPDFVDAALSTGAFGYVLKSSASEDLILAIHEAVEGKRFVSPSIST